MSSTTTEKRENIKDRKETVYERERERDEREREGKKERERVIGRKEGATRKLVSSTAQLLQFDLRIFWAERISIFQCSLSEDVR